ncbi:MAG: NADH-quinone oxidoreductase subunit NuoN [Isosphaeraceae bacterium]
MQPTLPSVDFRDFWFLAPAIVLSAWGLLVLMTDLALARRLTPSARRRTVGWLALVGVALALVAAVGLMQVEQLTSSESPPAWLPASLVSYFSQAPGAIFLGTLSADSQTAVFNVVFVVLLGLVIYMSMAWSFTEEWGEYFALLMWASVGMMLLAASEELITLFLTLETMTICLYLSTALEKTRRRSAEGGLKYFVYGSVSSALFLFGLSLLYGLTGTTQFEAIRSVLASNGPLSSGLSGNVAGATALLLMLVGFGFKVAAVPFHQWAPDAYEGAPAPVTAWIATGSKLASFIALMKVFLHALQPWSHPSDHLMGPGWLGVIAAISAVTMTYGNFAALAQRNLKRMLAYSSIAHAGYMLVGVAAASVSTHGAESAGSVLYYLVVYAFTNVGAFAVAAWLVRDKKTDDIDDLNGLGFQSPALAVCIVILMLSLIGVPPFAGFFGKLYMFMEALNQESSQARLTLIGLVALGLFNSVVSAFYYVRVLKAMFLREAGGKLRLGAAEKSIEIPIAIGALVAVGFGLFPGPLVSVMRAASVPMLTETGGGYSSLISAPTGPGYRPLNSRPLDASVPLAPGLRPADARKANAMSPEQAAKYAEQLKAASGRMRGMRGRRGPAAKNAAEPAKNEAAKSKSGEPPAKKAEAESKKTP